MKTLIKKLLGIRPFMDLYEEFCEVKYEWANDERFNNLYRDACERTGTKSFFPHKMRSYMLYELLKNIPAGEIAECGVFRGVTAYQIHRCTYRVVHLFDSFEGLSDRTPEDEGEGGRGIIACSLEEVQKNIGTGSFRYYKGWIPERFEEVKDLKFAFVHIDVDVYQPTRDSLDFFYPRMVSGGIIVIDDYGFKAWPGCRKAVEEMADKHSFTVIGLTTGQGVVFKK